MATACRSTSPQGLDHRLPPMRLWHKAKRLGVRDPRDIDLTRDAADWRALDGEQRDVILRLTALFQGGEESVTMDLLPLMMVVAQEGRQFGKRAARLEKARGQTLAEVMGTPLETEEAGAEDGAAADGAREAEGALA